MPTPLFRINDPKQRADFYAQLAALERAGIPPVQAIGLVNLEKAPGFEAARTQMQQRLTRGMGWAEAGRRYGLLSEFDAAILSAAQATGDLSATYRRLADHYDAVARRKRLVKSRLALPVAVLVLAAFIQPVPRLVLGEISSGAYLGLTLFSLFKLGLAVYVLLRLPSWFREGALASFKAAFDALLLRLPLFGKHQLRRNLRDFWFSLGMLLEAGLPMLDAFPKALSTVDNLVVRAKLAPAASALKRGSGLTEALRGLPWPGSSDALYFVATGESSGELPALLRRYVAQEDERIGGFDEQWAEWLPRLIYGAIMAMMAASILGSGAFMPKV